MVDPIDLSAFRSPTPRAALAPERPGPSDGPAAPSPAGDVVAPSLVQQIAGGTAAFDPLALAQQVGNALGGTGLSIGNARPDLVAALQP